MVIRTSRRIASGGSPQFRRRELLIASGAATLAMFTASRGQSKQPVGKHLEEEQPGNHALRLCVDRFLPPERLEEGLAAAVKEDRENDVLRVFRSTRAVEVLDWCHGVHHLSLALGVSGLAEDDRAEQYGRLRVLLKAGQSQMVIEALEALAAGQPDDSPVSREIGYLTRHSEAGRLRYHCFRCRGVPLGSGAIESTIRRMINLRLKGTSIFWKEANAEAVFQLRAAVLSGRWEEFPNHTQEAMARDRRTDWRWEPPACLAELKALDDEDEESMQPSTK